MGEVYRAKDSRLKREVALKVLPADVANDRERLARFQREAEVLAALNHPNIAHIHGLEESSGTIALVMELVEGEDLAERLKRGAIPLDEALPIAKQIAEALEAAHEQGIIHRDLKPANIKVRPDGTVKVLDFGLAKALSQDPKTPGPQDLANSPTITSPAMTMRGMILGTAAYMSPEQARGKAVDKRADVWAFGCVLYEILTRTPAFEGETLTDVLGAVVRAEPDWTRLPADTPSAVRRVLMRCLRKDAATRLRDIGDAAIELTEIEPTPVPAARASMSRAARIALLVAAAVAVIDRSGKRLAPDVATGGVFADPEFSPRGERLVYATTNRESGRSEIFVLNIADGRATVVASANGQIGNAIWSPDGHELAYIAFHEIGSSVYRLKLGSTAAPEELIAPGAGAVAPTDWTRDGTRLVWKRVSYGETGNDVMMLPLSGDRSSVPLVSTPAAENAGKVSPDGRWLAYSSDDSGRNEVYLQPFPRGGQRWQVSRDGGSFPRWRADGRELFFYTGNELAAAEVALSDAPRIGATTRLFAFERRPANVNDYPYAATPDGQRFVVNVRSDDPPTISIVVNWQAALGAAGRDWAGQ